MAQPLQQILTTKIFVARSRNELVAREELDRRLDAIPTRRLTLISAPAGFGKTTLVGGWIGSHDIPAAWISLDAGDNDLARFLSYLVAALRTVHPGIGEGMLEALSLSPLPPAETLLASLINDLATIGEHFLLVLDDYHLIESKKIHDAVTFLLDRAPSTLHLVLTTRSDPPFALARMRVRGELLELRASDLRFTVDEAARLFNGLARLGLSDEQLAALQERTEGWAAGLQMAALSLQGRPDVEEFIAAFTGADRYVLDYLLEEVLALLPEELQRIMLELSILDRFNGALCEAVTRCEHGADLLASLERRNLFLVPLDNHREWYRYHHLFADLLRHRLRQKHRDEVEELHRRASRWFEANGMVQDAMSHARLAGDVEMLARLVDRFWRSVVRIDDRELGDLLALLPDDAVRERPRLALLKAWLGTIRGKFDAAMEAVEWVKQGVEREGEDEAGRELIGQAMLLSSVVTRDSGDFEGTIHNAQRALALLPERPPASAEYGWNSSRGVALSVLGSAYSLLGDPVMAEEAMLRGAQYARSVNDIGNLIPALVSIGRHHIHMGKLNQAEEEREEMVGIAARLGGASLSIEMTLRQIRARVLFERHDLEGAREAAESALPFCSPYRANPSISLLKILVVASEALGDWEGAERYMRQFEQVTIPPYESSLTVMAPLSRAQLQLRAGKMEDALRWVADRFVDGAVNPLPQRSYFVMRTEELLYARVLIGLGRNEEAERIAASLQDEFTRTSILSIRLDATVLRAIALQNMGESAAALDLLIDALRAGAPEGFIRPFAYDAPAVARLLAELQKRPAVRLPAAYLRRVMQACGLGIPVEAASDAPVPGSAVESAGADAGGSLSGGVSGGVMVGGIVVEDMIPLTSREEEILRLLAQGYSNQKIADKLYVSINTVKTHVSNLFEKLGASSRVDALLRARSARLL
jgi:LuxR family maltose regulon positive regulatory protein